MAGGTYSAAAVRQLRRCECRCRWELPNWWCVGSCFSVLFACMVWPSRRGFCGNEFLWQRFRRDNWIRRGWDQWFYRDDSRHDREQRQEHFDDGGYSDSVGVGPAHHLESPTALAAAQRHLLAALGEGSLKRPEQAPAPCPFQSHRGPHSTAEPSRPTSLAGTRTVASLPVFRACGAARRSGLSPIRHSVGRSGQGSTAPADDGAARWGGQFPRYNLNR